MKHRMLALFTVCLFAASLFAANKKDEVPKEVQDGSLNDVSAIGHRNVGCNKGLGNWYSIDSQVNMGRQYAQQVESSVKLIKDPVIGEYINRVGQNLVRNSDSKVPFTIKVIDSDQVNAFALPGGFFYVNSGLILAADNEAELAGVMAHEIAHVAACHIAREQTRGNLANIASIPLIFVGGGIGYAVESAAGLALPVTFMKFSRGYDPQSFAAFFEKLEALEKKKPGFLDKAFDSHPPTPARAAQTQKEIAKILPARDEYVVDTSEFQDVKARLAHIENRRKVQNPNGKPEPSLRRTQQPADAPGTDDSGRPTLKRTGSDSH